MISNSRSRQWALATAVVGLLLLLGGCGGADDSDEAGTAATGSPVPPEDSGGKPAVVLGPDGMGAPVIFGLEASVHSLERPGMVTLTALVSGQGSALEKVEFHEVGKDGPVAVDASPPYTVDLPLGLADNGQRTYFVKAYGSAAGSVADASDRPVRVSVSIPANTLSFGGSARSELGYAAPGTVFGIAPDPHDPARFFAYSPYGAPAPVGFQFASVLDYRAGRTQTIDGVDAALAVDPKRVGRLVGLDRVSSSDLALRTSDDAGASWTTRPVSGSFGTNDDQIVATAYLDLLYSPSGHRLYVFAALGSSISTGWSFAVSADDGATWSTPRAGLPKGGAVGPVAVSAADPAVVYAQAHSRLHRSDDAGATFGAGLSLPVVTGLPNRLRMAADPFDARRLVVAGLTWEASSNRLAATIHRSLDGGRTWVAAALPAFPGRLPNTLASPLPFGPIGFSPSTPGLVYVPLAFGTDGGSVLRSTDGGATWTLRSYFDPSARGEAVRSEPTAFVVARTAQDGGVSLLVGGGAPALRDGVLRFIDRP